MKNQTEPHAKIDMSLDGEQVKSKKLVSIIIPFYNEEKILKDNIQTLIDYIETLRHEFEFEMLCIDDGSRDNSATIAKNFANTHSWIQLITHYKNLGLGKALQTGFIHSRGDYVIVLDADLSYSPEHIKKLLSKFKESNGKRSLIIASPYMQGGKVSHVTWARYALSRIANQFLSFLSKTRVKTLTGMVRGYEGEFIRNLSLRSLGPEINPEIIYKAQLLGEQIEEIPAHLSWVGKDSLKRSKLKIFRHSSNTLLIGFFLKPFLFFIIPGLLVLLFAIYSNTWMFIHIFDEYHNIQTTSSIDHLAVAFQTAYNLQPHTFLIAFLSTIISIQLLSFGMHSLQSKYYFEELFTLGTKILEKREKR